MLPLFAPFDAPTYVTRLWCLFELWTATSGECAVEIILPPSEIQRLEEQNIYGNHAQIEDHIIDRIDCNSAETSFPADTVRDFWARFPTFLSSSS